MKLSRLVSFALVWLSFVSLPQLTIASEADSVSDIQSMTLRSDGKYDVVCKSGKTEVVTIRQIHENDVCNSTPTPQPSPEVTAIFSHAEGDYYVLCVSHTWEIASSDAISSGNVCKTSVGQLPIGKWELKYNWRCKGTDSVADFETLSNRTFKSYPYTGKWTFAGTQFTATFDQAPHAVYTGTFDGQKKIKGKMTTGTMNGCFEMIFNQKSHPRPNASEFDSAGNKQ